MRALEGCRVLDLGIITAGAATSAVLADLGAEVIKVESPSYSDPFRKWTGEIFPGEHPDLPPFFAMTNRGKLNAGIDLKTPAGRDVFLDLVRHSDIVVENFRRGVLARLKLDFDALKAANPNIILASISSQGDDGPDAAYVSFGSTLEAMAGLASLTGYAGGAPVVSGIDMNYPDQVVAIFASSMIVTAWHARQSGRGGARLDMSQRELTSFLCGDEFADPEPARRRGNQQDDYAIQDCFRNRDGGWIALSVRGDQLDSLAQLVGSLDDLTGWIVRRTGPEAIEALNAIDVAATAVLDGGGVLADRGTGWTQALQTDRSGKTVKGFLFRDETAPLVAGAPAVLIGTHTRDVLKRIAGYSDRDIDALVASGAVTEGEPPRASATGVDATGSQ